MSESRTFSLSRSEILRRFRQRVGHGRGQHIHDEAHELIANILWQHDSDDADSLIGFCANADNLRPWLPAEADRIIFSAGLVEGLREIASVER